MSRNPRNQIYPASVEARTHRSRGLVVLWRWRTELLALVLLVMLVRAGQWLPFAALGSVISMPVATRFGRSWVFGHFWCVFSRHRIQRTCMETTKHTTRGRIPLILWITPTASGEKALIMTRAGISAEEFQAYGPELAAACWARQVQVHRHRQYANLLVLEIVRRDERPGAVAPGIERMYGTAWMPMASEEPLDFDRLLIPA
ncbi:MAG: hypothetical protein HOV86_25885 [Thermoactinospora sp.]|nr:hypothetical protein [Thermoactinospora sp.]